MGRKLVVRIKLLESSVQKMASGDISEFINIKGKDEITNLGNYINELNTNLRTAMDKMHEVSEKNIQGKDKVLKIMEETSSSAVQISANSKAITQQIETLSLEVSENVTASQEIETSLNNLNNQIQNQTAMVEESTASVTEMIASINNVQAQTENNKSTTENLVEYSKTGGINLKKTVTIQHNPEKVT